MRNTKNGPSKFTTTILLEGTSGKIETMVKSGNVSSKRTVRREGEMSTGNLMGTEYKVNKIYKDERTRISDLSP